MLSESSSLPLQVWEPQTHFMSSWKWRREKVHTIGIREKCGFWENMLFISKVLSEDGIEQKHFDFLMFLWQKSYFRNHLSATSSIIHTCQEFCQNMSLLFKQDPDMEQLYSNHAHIQFDSFRISCKSIVHTQIDNLPPNISLLAIR